MSVELNLLNMSVTSAVLRRNGDRPFFSGDDWSTRIQVRNATSAISLTGTDIVLTIVTGVGDLLRRNGVQIGVTGVFEIVFDNQASEDPIAETGTGWFTINFHQSEKSTFDTMVGEWPFDLRLEFADGKEVTFMRGVWEIDTILGDPIP